MEIEKKYLVNLDGIDLQSYPCHQLEQGYLSTNPVVRVRKEDDDYYLTYKGKGKMVREEYNLPLTKESYEHLKEKSDGALICKTRYLIPYDKYTIELDVFSGNMTGLIMAEVEFDSVEDAQAFVAPSWFTKEVTQDSAYHNSHFIYVDRFRNDGEC